MLDLLNSLTATPEIHVSLLTGKNAIVSLLREAGGDSLTCDEIAEETGMTTKQVRVALKALCDAPPDSQCVFEDGEGFSYAEPVVDNIVIGF